MQQEDDDPLSSVCVFGLTRIFMAVFESRFHVDKAHIDQLLATASTFGDLGIARLLIDSGADVWTVSPDGWTPLLRASEKGHEAVVRLLIDRGADVWAEYRSTPLHPTRLLLSTLYIWTTPHLTRPLVCAALLWTAPRLAPLPVCAGYKWIPLYLTLLLVYAVCL